MSVFIERPPIRFYTFALIRNLSTIDLKLYPKPEPNPNPDRCDLILGK